MSPFLIHHVHHVQRHHHGQADFNELGGQIQVALEVGGVHDVEDGVGFFIDEIIAGNDFLKRVRRERVDAGKVLNDDFFIAL